MRHHLIDSAEGWKYRPFAENCIVKLRRLGEYGSQQYEVDGFSIKVRVEPGHEYISISGGGCSLAMDSGGVASAAIGIKSVARDIPGVLFDLGATTAYHTPFVAVPGSVDRKNPGKGSAGQIAGVVTHAKDFKGRITYDPNMAQWFGMTGGVPANCLSPGWEEVDDPSDPGKRIWRPKGAVAADGTFGDTDLAEKKLTMLFCPSSIFTGKTRLYAQAMYGVPTHVYDSMETGGPRIEKKNPHKPIAGLFGDGGPSASPPALNIKAYVAAGDFKVVDGKETEELKTYADVVLTTSHGVFLDKQHGLHYLIEPGYGVITVYPLVGTRCAESLRKYLTPAHSEGMSEADIENLETYILAYSLPDVKNKKVVNVPGLSGMWSMGYGWHWNWSGTAADGVSTASISTETTPHKGRMSSSHYRLSVSIVSTKDEGRYEFTVNAQRVVIESDQQWAVSRYTFPIAEPSYIAGYLEKITPRVAHPLIDCDAPFYAFYRKDEIVVCRVKSWMESEAPRREMSEGYATSTAPGSGTVVHSTYGMSDGFVRDTTGAEFRRVQFTAGGYSTPAMSTGHGIFGWEATTTNKNLGGYYLRWNSEWWPPPYSYTRYDYFYEFSWTREQWETYKNLWGSSEIAVPFNDSEAIYIDAMDCEMKRKGNHYRWDLSTKTGRPNEESGGISIGWKYRYLLSYAAGGGAAFDVDAWASGITDTRGNPAIFVPPTTVTTYSPTRALVCRAGVVSHAPITTGHQLWHDPTSDFVESRYDTRSSAKHTSTAVFSNQCGVMHNCDRFFTTAVGNA